jgi:integrase
MRTKLTPSFVQKARVETGKDRALFWDASLPGFGLLVTASGHRSYVVQYRFGRRSRRMTIDGVLGLAAARKRARALLGEVAHDRDPLQERQDARSLAEETFKSVAEAYFAREGDKLRTARDRQRALENHVYDYKRFGAQPIRAIRRSDIARLLDHIADEAGPVMANRTLAYISKIMNWYAANSDDWRPPIVRGMARVKERARNRDLKDDELRAVWKAAESTPGPFGAFVKFLLLTGARRSEAAEMTWSEVSGTDWTLPAARNKVDQDLIRPLSAAAMATITALPRIGRAGFVFTTAGDAPIGGFARFKRRLDAACGVTGWTLHDLRRTARTLMSRAGVSNDHAERCLGHVKGGVRGVYDRYEFHEQKRHAYEELAALIERIVNPPPANVVALKGSA